jgi:hypothetical protein
LRVENLGGTKLIGPGLMAKKIYSMNIFPRKLILILMLNSQVKDLHLLLMCMIEVHFCSKQYCILNTKAHSLGSKMPWLEDSLAWSYNTFTFVISLSIGPNMELSGIKGAKIELGY